MNDKQNKRIVVLSGTRFENLLTRDNFLTYNDADSMDEARRALSEEKRDDRQDSYSEKK